MNKYHQTKIYKLTNTINDQIYVGSTIETLQKRLRQHMEKGKLWPNRKLYKMINNIGGWQYVNIELIESRQCNDVNEKKTLERKYILEIKPVLNYRKPSAVIINIIKDNKESVITWKKAHYEENKETILKYSAEFIECNICLKQYMRRHKNAHIKTKYHIKHIND